MLFRPLIDEFLREKQTVVFQICALWRIFEGVKHKSISLVATFVDFRKEFDSVNRSKLLTTWYASWISETADCLSGAKYFSTLDTDRGFWQVGIAEEEKLKFKGWYTFCDVTRTNQPINWIYIFLNMAQPREASDLSFPSHDNPINLKAENRKNRKRQKMVRRTGGLPPTRQKLDWIVYWFLLYVFLSFIIEKWCKKKIFVIKNYITTMSFFSPFLP